MIQGADGAWYVDATSAAAGSRAFSQGVFSSVPDNQASVFGSYPMSADQASGAGLPTLPGLPSITGGAPSSWRNNFNDAFNNSIVGRNSTFGHIMSGIGSAVIGVGSAAKGASDTVSSVGSFLTAISDVKRDITIILGLVLVVVGIIALTKHEAVQVVAGALPGADVFSRGSTES